MMITMILKMETIHYRRMQRNSEIFSYYLLDDYTSVRIDQKTAQLSYQQFSDYTMKDIKRRRFGWIRAHKRLYPYVSAEEQLHQHFSLYKKESYGKAWIENEVLVLGPIEEQPPEADDSYFIDTLEDHFNTFEPWQKQNIGLKRNRI